MAQPPWHANVAFLDSGEQTDPCDADTARVCRGESSHVNKAPAKKQAAC